MALSISSTEFGLAAFAADVEEKRIVLIELNKTRKRGMLLRIVVSPAQFHVTEIEEEDLCHYAVRNIVTTSKVASRVVVDAVVPDTA